VLRAIGKRFAVRTITIPLLTPFAVVAAAALVGAVVTQGDASMLFAVHGAFLCFAIWLYRRLDQRAIDRPVGLLRLSVLLISNNSMMLIIASALSDGDFRYATLSGSYSHQSGAPVVVLANVLFTLALCAPAFLGPRRANSAAAPLSPDLPPKVLRWLVFVGGAVVFARGALLFWPSGAAEVVAYFVRLFASLLGPTVLFIGIALRLRTPVGLLFAAFAAGVSAVTLLAGSRWDAIFPIVLLSAGYVLARPIGGTRLFLLGSAGLAVLFTALFVGQALREDGAGRSGAAALQRTERLGDRLGASEARSGATAATVGRLVSNSTHAVITRIPEEVPHEDGGLISIPVNLIESLLPRFNWSGTSESELPRNWVLNKLGFVVNWTTSVEFPLLPDAWYRGGWIGTIIVGLLAGTILHLAEGYAYRSARRRPEGLLLLVVLVSGLPGFLGRDIVWAARALVFNLVAAIGLLKIVRILAGRTRIGAGR
jgi:hypothetical protein